MPLPTKTDHKHQLFDSRNRLGTRKAVILLPFQCSEHTEKGQAAAILLQFGTPCLKLAGQPQASLLAPAIAVDKFGVARVKPLTASEGSTRPCRATGGVRCSLSSSSRRESHLLR